ncbi:MAG: PAC2 family protein [Nitrososphaerota archaeon]|nr:PAC2 family protein [Nitrososphaerota archaeon]
MARAQEVRIILTKQGGNIDLRGASVIDASPSAGAAPLIAINYIVENLKPIKIAEVKSLYFPHVSLVNGGVAASPKIELYMYEDAGVKLLFIVRNFVIDSLEGGYAIADKLYRFLAERGACNYYLLTGLRMTGERATYVASVDPEDTRRFIESGARLIQDLENVPADKLSSYLLFLYLTRSGKAWILVAETVSYFPDPIAARELIQVLSKGLGFRIDLEKLDEEIEKQRILLEEFQKDYERMLQEGGKRDKEPFYIG